MKYFQLLIFTLAFFSIKGQEATVFGVIKDIDTDQFIDYVTVFEANTTNATESDSYGQFKLVIDAEKATEIKFSRIGYLEASFKISPMKAGSKRYLTIKLAPETSDLDIVIRASRIEDGGMVREEVTEFKKLPTASGNFESVLPNIALGVTSGTGGELSAQYNVRGGNYDENLIYVNDFEIFRPQLIRSGQQEGLSFPNIDMIRDLSFSSGGFESKYGDKMSSVLDIRYKRPDAFKASVSGSLLGASAHVEGSKRVGANAYNKFRYILGGRYKTSRYILGSLDVQGEYVPDFVDVQGYFTYDITKDLQVGLISNYNYSRYKFVTQSRETALRLITLAVKLSTLYEGQETNRFINNTNGLSLTYVPDGRENPLYLKFLASRFTGSEEENFDILGFYRLSQIETDLGSNDFGTEVAVLGVGTQHTFARNYLYNNIGTVQHKGGIEIPNEDNSRVQFIQWGVKYQRELFEDELNEWERIDSSGYSLPYTGESVNLSSVLKTQNDIVNDKVEAFAQNTITLSDKDKYDISINGGLRFTYLGLSNQTLLSPRFNLQYQPLGIEKDITFRFAGGVYYQAPLYRELRRRDGTVNIDLKAQQSIHLVGGITYDFLWEGISRKPFRLISELYFKKLNDLVSYDQDNVRIRYSGENDATGYVTGADFRLNGEFVPGAESWINLSLLRARESLNGVQHFKRVAGDTTAVAVSDVPRPTDRFFNLNMFFQDYLPRNENFKVNLNFSFGSGLPYGRKDDNIEFRNSFRFNTYRRVDIGFSYQIWNEAMRANKPNHPFRSTNNAWVSLEVFNILGVENTAANTWIKSITNNQFAIPNRLTSRRVNLRFRVDF